MPLDYLLLLVFGAPTVTMLVIFLQIRADAKTYQTFRIVLLVTISTVLILEASCFLPRAIASFFSRVAFFDGMHALSLFLLAVTFIGDIWLLYLVNKTRISEDK